VPRIPIDLRLALSAACAGVHALSGRARGGRRTLVAMEEDLLLSLPKSRVEGTKVVMVPIGIRPGSWGRHASQVLAQRRTRSRGRPQESALGIFRGRRGADRFTVQREPRTKIAD